MLDYNLTDSDDEHVGGGGNSHGKKHNLDI
jgi:hypothetical protein